MTINHLSKICVTTIFMMYGGTSQVHAALANNAVLDFYDGIQQCALNADPSTTSGCEFDVMSTTVSYFGVDVSGDGVIQDNERTGLTSAGVGITLGTSQAVGEIDIGTDFAGNLWGHFTTQGLTVDSSLGNTASLNMTGWNAYWQGTIPWNTGSNATITCDVDCLSGESFTLDYSSVNQEPGVFAGFYYELHMEGTIASAVPVPAAVWLFGSGLIGLFSFSRRRNH